MLVAGNYTKPTPHSGEEQWLPLITRRAVEDAISSCEDVEELIDVLDWMETFEMCFFGSEKVWPPAHFIEVIYKGLAFANPNHLTRSLGLRDKYVELTRGVNK